jgi:ribosome recycling factor
MLDDIKKDANERMNKCVAALKNELKKLRTGRAHTSLLEHIRVEYYGNEVPLNQVANLALEDARTLTVTPWEKSMVQVVEKAIMKVVRHEAENARVAVRNVRRDVMTELKEMLKEKLVSQDDDRRAQDEVQKLTDRHVAEIDQILAEKEKELMQV